MRYKRNEKGLTLIELTVALMVTGIILAAVATLAYALGSVGLSSDETCSSQAELRSATLRISELIRNSKLICGTPGDDLVIWRADDNGDGMINPPEVVYIEAGVSRSELQLLEFFWEGLWYLTIEELQDINTKDALMLLCSSYRRIMLVPQCSNVQYIFDEPALPPTKRRFVSIWFELSQDGVLSRYQISSALHGWAGNLLDSSGNLVSDDD
jgi:prepilin-type N-terminal cleavage/methylation domain-containing protein